MATILAVSADVTFAAMLKEGVEALGSHQFVLATTGNKAHRVVVQQDIDLAIVDVDMEDPRPIALVKELRQLKPTLSLMWLLFLGHRLPGELQAVNVQGTLTKPFFIEDLSGKIEAALAQPVQTAGPDAQVEPTSPAPPSETPTPGPQKPAPLSVPQEEPSMPIPLVRELPLGSPQVQARLEKLSQDLSADTVLLLDRGGQVLARAGYGGRNKTLELAVALMREVQACRAIARFLGEKSGRFGNCVAEGEEYRLFTLIASDDDTTLSVVLRSDTPLGTVRYHLKQAATDLNNLLRRTR